MSEAKAPRVRVIVADDHPVYREGVARAIKGRPEFEFIAEADDGREALDMIRELSPDVAVLDVQMPGLQGNDVLHAVKRDGLPTRIVLLSAHVDSETVYRAVASGAGAYLSKESSRERICDAVAAVARGEVVLSAEVQAGLASEIQIRERDERPALTPREHEILVLTANGHSAPDIGKQLHLSQSTVKTHLKSLYEKLGVSDRAAAVAEAMRRGCSSNTARSAAPCLDFRVSGAQTPKKRRQLLRSDDGTPSGWWTQPPLGDRSVARRGEVGLIHEDDVGRLNSCPPPSLWHFPRCSLGSGRPRWVGPVAF